MRNSRAEMSSTGKRDERAQLVEVTSGLGAGRGRARDQVRQSEGRTRRQGDQPGARFEASPTGIARHRRETSRESQPMWMTRVSINHPVFATMVMVALTVLGSVFVREARGRGDARCASARWCRSRCVIRARRPEQVENDIAKPIENAVNTVAGVKRILSASYEGISLLMDRVPA